MCFLTAMRIGTETRYLEEMIKFAKVSKATFVKFGTVIFSDDMFISSFSFFFLLLLQPLLVQSWLFETICLTNIS